MEQSEADAVAQAILWPDPKAGRKPSGKRL